MFIIITNQILKMLLIMLVGYICYRAGLVDQQGNKTLANLLLMVINPIVALMALQTEYKPELASGLLTAYLLAFITHIIGVILSSILIKRTGNPDYSIERFSAMYSNCGFIGIPLVQSILGSEGVIYLTAYMTVFNIFSWTHGIILMTGKASWKDLKKGLLSPMLIACIAGPILFFSRIRFPAVMGDAMNYIGAMNTPLAMMIAGISVAQTDLLSMFKKKRLYAITLIKLFALPLIMFAILALIRINTTVAYTILVASACPAAATCTAFSLRFQKNYRYASEMYALSTLCSLISIPILIYAAERLLG